MQGPNFSSLSSRAHKALPLRTSGPSSRSLRARLRCHSTTGNAATPSWTLGQASGFLQENGVLIALVGGMSVNFYKLDEIKAEQKEMKAEQKEMKADMATKDDLTKLRSDVQKDFQLFYTSAENALLKEQMAELSPKRR